MTKPPPASSTTTGDTARVWKGNIFLDPLHLALCVAVLKHLLLTNLFLDSIHSYFVSSQAKICQIHFWILVKNFFSFSGLPTLNFVFDSVQALVFGLVSLCVAVLKHLLLTNLFLDSIHSYFVSSQAKICQIHFWILVKNFFSFFGLPTLNFVFDNAQALVFGLVCVCVCVLGPLQSFTVQTLNDISLFNGVSQFDKVCGGRLRREMRF